MIKRKNFKKNFKEGLKTWRFHKINEDYSEDVAPRVYVGTYGLYNEGSLEGDWFNLFDFDNKEDFYKAIEKRFRGIDNDPEYMFQDSEFCGGLVREYTIDDRLFDLIEDYKEDDRGLDWETYIDVASDFDIDDIFLIVSDYSGDDSKIGYAAIDNIEDLPKEDLERFFDYEAYGRDIRLEYPSVEKDGAIYIFNPR